MNRRQKVREAIVFRKYADKRGREQQLTRKLNGRREREREREKAKSWLDEIFLSSEKRRT